MKEKLEEINDDLNTLGHFIFRSGLPREKISFLINLLNVPKRKLVGLSSESNAFGWPSINDFINSDKAREFLGVGCQ